MDTSTGPELGLVALSAMVSPTTLTFSVLVLVLGDRPRRTGFLFYVGALGATLAVGVVAAFVLGDVAASPGSTPKTWVAIVDVIAGALLIAYGIRLLRRPPDPKTTQSMVDKMSSVASSPAVAVIGAGAALANPGAFIPLALKAISETDPTAAEYVAEWVAFALVSLLPLAIALLFLVVARTWTEQLLGRVRAWLERRVMTVAAVVILLFAAALLRNGIAGLTN
jgi:hypothetical protein